MLIEGVDFQFVDNIEPKFEPAGRILEDRPAGRYNNPKSLPLNKHGEGPFCQFRIHADRQTLDSLGVYAFVETPNKVLYIGKTADTLGKRINAGFGRIQPRNCYQGGQSTNCRVNHLILETAKQGRALTVVFHACVDKEQASTLECELIMKTLPKWNDRVPRC